MIKMTYFSRLKRTVITLTLPACLLTTSSLLAQSDDLFVNVGPCIMLESAIQRFACYENQVESTLTGQPAEGSVSQRTLGSTPSAPPTPSVPSVPSPAVAPPNISPATSVTANTRTRSAEESFGLPAEVSEEEANEEELFSTITSLEENVPSRYVITLANGQVWRQTRADARFRMEVGHEVRIYPSRWGEDYRMSIEKLRSYTQVERVR